MDLEKDLFYLVKTTYKNITITVQNGFNTESLIIPNRDDIKSLDEFSTKDSKTIDILSKELILW